MEDQQVNVEPTHQFENIDFNSSADENNKESSHNEEPDQVKINLIESRILRRKTKRKIRYHFSSAQSKANLFQTNYYFRKIQFFPHILF